jgi:ribosome-binding protein aMBF1 (putative translation factor)
MNTNERQYRITKAEAERFEQALTRAKEQGARLDPRLQKAMEDGLVSQLADLRKDLAAYEALRSGEVAMLELESLDELPAALIRARAAAGISQRELARRLGLKEQQIQRYESTGYAGATLARLQAVANALGVTIREQVVLPRRD